MRRREFIAMLGGATLAAPLAARAQAMPVVGFLGSESPESWAGRVNAFRRGLGETGHVEGRNVGIEFRWARGRNDRLPALAAELVGAGVNAIAANGPAAFAAKVATSTVPVVFVGGFDPVKTGLVASLNRPGGNLTGVTTLAAELTPKRLELLHQLVPAASTAALLVNPTGVNAEILSKDTQAAAGTLGLRLHIVHASAEREFEGVFANLAQLRLGGLVIGSDGFFNSRADQLATLALRHGVPAIYQYREFAAPGGLMSYGSSTTDAFHLVGVYIGRILKGEQPADLPVQQASKVELIVNLKTAKALGIDVPLPLLGRADEVIE